MIRLCILCGLFFSLGLLPAQSVTIDWGSGVGDTMVDSQGNALDDSFIFELGSFGSFMPTSSNLSLWAANWKVFDRAQAPASEGWNSTFSYFSSSATLLTGGFSSESPPLPSFTFAEDEQAYIFIYDSLTADFLSEWALITNNGLDGSSADDWLFPAPGGKTDIPIEWRVSNSSTVIYGGLDDEQGAGNYTVDPGVFALQTHTVPEPSAALFIALAGCLQIMRRRRI